MQPSRASLLTCLALVLAAGLAAAGEAKTPLGKWMKPNMGAPLAGQDFAALQKGFDLVASKQPGAAYAKWASIAQGGSSAAAKQDLAGVKAACKSCHHTYKQQYIADFPDKSFP